MDGKQSHASIANRQLPNGSIVILSTQLKRTLCVLYPHRLWSEESELSDVPYAEVYTDSLTQQFRLFTACFVSLG